MRAIQIKRYGPADALALVDMPAPSPGPQDVIVKVQAVGVNRLDVLLRQGEVFQVPLPRVPGTDIVGVIVEVGIEVDRHRLGEPVFAAPILACGTCEHCLRGDDNLCAGFGTVGSTIDGGYAEYVRLPARNALPLPPEFDALMGASFALTYATAAAMFRRARLAAGETVVVLGASGGLGCAAVELGCNLGAEVLAVTRDPSADDALLALGAKAVLRPGPSMPGQVHDLTSGRGAHVVFEHVGSATFEHSVASLGTAGRLVFGGVTTGTRATLDLKALFTKRLEVIGCRGSGRRDLEAVLELVRQGLIHPRVDEVLSLEDAAEAHLRLEAGKVFGKIVLAV